jgi:hypothetical protein
LKGDVIHRRRLESLLRALRARHRRSGRRRYRQASNQLPAVHLPSLKIINQFRDHLFHGGCPFRSGTHFTPTPVCFKLECSTSPNGIAPIVNETFYTQAVLKNH